MGIKYPASSIEYPVFPLKNGISASLQQAPSTHNPWRGQEIEKN
jgi:hypothetical protein